MKYLLTMVFSLFTAVAFAEMIGPVEYHLPEAAKEWKVGNRLENDKGKTVIYVPQGVERIDSQEFFGATYNIYHTDINDLESLKTAINKFFPQATIDLKITEKNNDNILYTWTATENGVEKGYGMGRAFSLKDGTVLLSYTNQMITNKDRNTAIWLPALKDAKIK